MLLIGCLSIEEWLAVKLKVVWRLSFVEAQVAVRTEAHLGFVSFLLLSGSVVDNSRKSKKFPGIIYPC